MNRWVFGPALGGVVVATGVCLADDKRSCDREHSTVDLVRGRTSGVLGETGFDGHVPFIAVDAAWWRSIAQAARQNLADITHCAEGRWGTVQVFRILDKQNRTELGVFAAGAYKDGGR